MPFQSEAQRRKFGAMVSRGEISKETFREWNDATEGELPERKKMANEMHGGMDMKSEEKDGKKKSKGKISKGGFQKYLAKRKKEGDVGAGSDKMPMSMPMGKH